MKPVMEMTPAQIRAAAHDAIIRELGVSGLVRYLQDQSLGQGDYTRDRHLWLSDSQTAEELFAEIETTAEDLKSKGKPASG